MFERIYESFFTSLIYMAIPVLYCGIILLLTIAVRYLVETRSRYVRLAMVSILAMSLAVFAVTVHFHVWNARGTSSSAGTDITDSSGRPIVKIDVVTASITSDKIIAARDLVIGTGADIQYVPYTAKNGKVTIAGRNARYEGQVEQALKDMGSGSFTGKSLSYTDYNKIAGKQHYHPLSIFGIIIGLAITCAPFVIVSIDCLLLKRRRRKTNMMLKSKLKDI